MKKIVSFAFSLFCLTSSITYADWNTETLLEVLDGMDTSILENAEYEQIKAQVLQETKGSWCSEEKATLLMDLIVVQKPKVCVEIGAGIGSSLLPIATALKFIEPPSIEALSPTESEEPIAQEAKESPIEAKKAERQLYSIDAWSNEIATRYWSETDPNKSWWSTVDMNALKQTCQSLIDSHDLASVCILIQAPSEEAVSQLEEIDFLHLDGDYSKKGSMQDVKLYLPKVKSGGYILLSNLFTMVEGKNPKLDSFLYLMEHCELVCEIEHDNAMLFKKD